MSSLPRVTAKEIYEAEPSFLDHLTVDAIDVLKTRELPLETRIKIITEYGFNLLPKDLREAVATEFNMRILTESDFGIKEIDMDEENEWRLQHLLELLMEAENE